jgi:hypothetical protein
MASIRVTCPQCKGSGPAPEAFLGIKVQCPRCGAIYTVDETVAELPQVASNAADVLLPAADEADALPPPPPPAKRFPLIPLIIGVVVLLGGAGVALFVYPGFLKPKPPVTTPAPLPTDAAPVAPVPATAAPAATPPPPPAGGGAPATTPPPAAPGGTPAPTPPLAGGAPAAVPPSALLQPPPAAATTPTSPPPPGG